MDRTIVVILADVLKLIEKIPATFWGIVIGSFFTLGGVVLTNRANDRRLREQLRHDRELRNRDRELSLRKDVYLSAAEAISAGLNTVGRFADLDIPNNKLTEAYIEKSPAIAKVHLIANEETTKALTSLVSELTAVYLRLFAKRFPLVMQKAQIAFLQQQMESFSRERDRMLDLMKQFNLEGATDKHRWEVIQGNFKFEQDRITETSKQHATLLADLFPKELDLVKECMEGTNRLNRLLVPVVVAARRELEIPLDEAAYAKVIEESVKTQEASLNEFMKNIQSLLTAQQSSAPDAPESAPR
jgi:hypothetical protein